MTPALREAVNETLSTSFTLLVFSVVCASLLAGAYIATRPNIEQSEQLEKIQLLSQVLPARGFDNDPVKAARPLAADPLLGLKRPGTAFLATQAGVPVAVALEAVAPDGYAGEIKLLIGIRADGRIAGVRVTGHRETPGLGDYIEVAKGTWIRQFEGKGLDHPAETGWKVRKDGGQFDYLAGATITPRAVVRAVRRALRYFEEHRDELLRTSPPPGERQGRGSGASIPTTVVPSPQPSPGGRGGRLEEPQP